MKKIATITFHNSDNYGAILQTKALQVTIEKLGYETEIIDYVCQNKIKMYKTIDLDLEKGILRNGFQIPNSLYKVIKKNKVKNFMLNSCKVSKERYFSSKEMKNLDKKYDLFITGSDQVWNYMNTKFDKAYFLDFVKDSNKKMSYAASFALTEIEEKYEEEYKKLLKDIQYLSIREVEGKKILDKFKLNSQIVLDPTLLLTRDEWADMIKINKDEKEYILLYTLHNSKEIKECTTKLSEKTGLKVIKICGNILDYLGKFKTTISTPEEYVELINNAKYVVTDSFHGVAFSVNLNTNFYFYRGKNIKTHSRIDNLLRICNLEKRAIENIKELIVEDIDYSKTNVLLEKERKKSLDFLSTSIKSSLGE